MNKVLLCQIIILHYKMSRAVANSWRLRTVVTQCWFRQTNFPHPVPDW